MILFFSFTKYQIALPGLEIIRDGNDFRQYLPGYHQHNIVVFSSNCNNDGFASYTFNITGMLSLTNSDDLLDYITHTEGYIILTVAWYNFHYLSLSTDNSKFSNQCFENKFSLHREVCLMVLHNHPPCESHVFQVFQ